MNHPMSNANVDNKKYKVSTTLKREKGRFMLHIYSFINAQIVCVDIYIEYDGYTVQVVIESLLYQYRQFSRRSPPKQIATSGGIITYNYIIHTYICLFVCSCFFCLSTFFCVLFWL